MSGQQGYSNRPILKWAGGKYLLAERIRAILPDGQRLVEPFVGSAAFFLNSNYPKALLCDSNADLINLYKIIKVDGEPLITRCKRYFIRDYNNADDYYRLREKFNNSKSPMVRAALFIYLNKHGYNGLCRYNKKGTFNVPFGRYKAPAFPIQQFRHFMQQLERVELCQQSFQETFQQLRKGDVVYCDPPYAPLEGTKGFTDYSSGGFDLEQQEQLAELAQQAAQRGNPVLISNHDTPQTRKLYQNAELTTLKVRRYISCNSKQRNMANELLALFRPS